MSNRKILLKFGKKDLVTLGEKLRKMINDYYRSGITANAAGYNPYMPQLKNGGTTPYNKVIKAQEGIKSPRLNGNARCFSKSMNAAYEGLTESQAIENGLVKLTPDQTRSILYSVVEPNNMQITPGMVADGFNFYTQPTNGGWKTNNIYIGCPSELDLNAHPVNVSTGWFDNSSMNKKETLENLNFFRTFNVNPADEWHMHDGVDFDENGNIVFKNGVVNKYTNSFNMSPLDYANSTGKPLLFMDHTDDNGLYYLKLYNLRELLKKHINSTLKKNEK